MENNITNYTNTPPAQSTGLGAGLKYGGYEIHDYADHVEIDMPGNVSIPILKT